MAIPAKNRLSREDRRSQIIEASRDVFLQHGLAGARTRDIAQAAGVNEALLYQHFRSKEEIFEAAVLLPLEEVVADLAQAAIRFGGHLDFDQHRDVTERFVQNLLDVMVESVSFLGVVLFANGEGGRVFYQEHVAPLIDAVAQVVRRNLPVWPHRFFDPEVVVTAVFGMCFGLAMHGDLTGRRLDTERVTRQMTELIMRGLLAPEGDVVTEPAEGPGPRSGRETFSRG